MSKTRKDYQESRIARINIAITPIAKNQIEMLASVARLTTNELLNRVIDDFIKKNEKLLKKYTDFTESESVIFGQVETQQVENNTPSVTPSLSDEQKQTAINKIVKFINENQDKVIDENEERTADTIGVRIPARKRNAAFVAVIANTVKHLIDDETIKTLVKRTTVKGKKENNIIRIEQSALLASNNSTETNND